MKNARLFAAICLLVALASPAAKADVAGYGPDPLLPKPFATKPVRKPPAVTGWPAGKAPIAPPGFKVTRFADNLDDPRWIYVLPNGDVLVSGDETGSWFVAKPHCITLLRDADGDGVAETRTLFLQELNEPFGMALVKDTLYVGDTDAVLRFPYKSGETQISAEGEKVLSLPAEGYTHHWTRNLLSSKDGAKLYVSVGSSSNDAEYGYEKEKHRANVLELHLDGTGARVFASGLRNPVGMGWEPATGKLWTAVNERDNLGDDLVPDFMTALKDGAFYGWPFFYFGPHQDPRWAGENAALAARVTVPDYALGAHTASLGLAFYEGKNFPQKYRGGVFIGQHGSWNRSTFAGYKVIYIPFRNGKPDGMPQDFLTGFMPDPVKGIAYGRPVGVATAKDGALLVADDAGGVIWRVVADKN